MTFTPRPSLSCGIELHTFPICINQISTLPPPHILIRTILQVTIPARTLAVVPINFTTPPKVNCYKDLSGTHSITDTDQDLFIVPLLEIFSVKISTTLLCTIIYTNPNHVTLLRNKHTGKLSPLNPNIQLQTQLL